MGLGHTDEQGQVELGSLAWAPVPAHTTTHPHIHSRPPGPHLVRQCVCLPGCQLLLVVGVSEDAGQRRGVLGAEQARVSWGHLRGRLTRPPTTLHPSHEFSPVLALAST